MQSAVNFVVNSLEAVGSLFLSTAHVSINCTTGSGMMIYNTTRQIVVQGLNETATICVCVANEVLCASKEQLPTHPTFDMLCKANDIYVDVCYKIVEPVLGTVGKVAVFTAAAFAICVGCYNVYHQEEDDAAQIPRPNRPRLQLSEACKRALEERFASEVALATHRTSTNEQNNLQIIDN